MDASLSGAWLLPDESSAAADRLLESALRGRNHLAAPALWTYEILNLLLSAARRGRIAEGRVEEALSLVQRVPISCYDHDSPLSRVRILRFAQRFALSAYDASYLELADRLQAPLATLDTRLAETARALGLPNPPLG
jgi:predicted nucleic acid-binding protein